ncbi:MAG: DUF4249 family protein [Rhodothermaceae bacterium]
MKVKIFISAILLFFLTSCDDSVEPNGEFREKTILLGILEPGISQQLINVAKSYPTAESILPENLPVQNADVKIWFDEEIKKFHFTEIEVSDTIIKGGKLGIYRNNDFEIISGKTYEVEALMDNGDRLSAVTTVPERLGIYNFPENRKVNPENGDDVIVKWETFDENFKILKANIVYEKPVNGELVQFKAPLPQRYENRNGELIPVYHKPGNVNSFIIDGMALDRELRKIGEGREKKFEIIIKYISMEILTYDVNLSRYIESTSGSNNSIITIDQVSFSNVTGGEGFFGSFNRQYSNFYFDFEYVRSLGYTPRDIIE